MPLVLDYQNLPPDLATVCLDECKLTPKGLDLLSELFARREPLEIAQGLHRHSQLLLWYRCLAVIST